jgi:hypothetical protein
MKLSDMIRRQAKHVLLYGPPKLGGKTWLAGQLSRFGFRLRFIDLENGRTTLYQLPLEAQNNIDVINIQDTKDFPIAAETVPKIFKGDPVSVCNTHGKVGCMICLKNDPADFTKVFLKDMKEDEIVILDSLTQFSNSLMSHIGRDKDDLWRPEWSDYRTQGAMLDRLLSTIQNATYNVIVITHESMVPLEDGKERLVPVAGTTNFSRNTAKYFDEVIYCAVKNKKHVAASSSTYAHDILTGSRTGAILEKEDEASLLKIFRPDALVSFSQKQIEAERHLSAVQQQIKK